MTKEAISADIAYATAKNCQEAILIYPVDLPHPIDEWLGDDRPLHLRSLTFSTHGHLKNQGEKFLNHLFQLTDSP